MSKHTEQLANPDHDIRWLGEIAGLAVDVTDDGVPLLFVHGDEQSAAMSVTDASFADGLSRAGVEIEEVLDDG